MSCPSCSQLDEVLSNVMSMINSPKLTRSGCRIAVAQVDVAKAAKPVEWKGISALFNFEFLASGIRAWKAYAIGEGQMFPYDEVGRSLQGSTGLPIIMPLTPLTPLSKPGLLTVKVKHITNLQDLFMCEEEGCVATF